MRWMRSVLWGVLVAVTSAMGQESERVEGETGIYSREGGQELEVRLPGVGEAAIDFVWIEPGTFKMGSLASEENREPEEGPRHDVTLSQGFYLGIYEITQGQWEAVMGEKPWLASNSAPDGPSFPAVYISWDDMQAFIQRLNQAAGANIYRLPTEAEWEYACRAGSTSRWSFGDDEGQLDDYAWYDDFLGGSKPKAVGQKLSNAWGLYDMHGNVWEWVQDWYDHSYYRQSPAVDPPGPDIGPYLGPEFGPYKVTRGGGYFNESWWLRSAARGGGTDPTLRRSSIGARLVRGGPKLTGTTAIPQRTWGQAKQEGR